MRQLVFIATVGICLLVALQPWNTVVVGLIVGLGLGMVMLLFASAMGGSLGRWLQQTRLEDQILSLEDDGAALGLSPLYLLDQLEQNGIGVSPWRQEPPGAWGEKSRRFVWEDELPSAEIFTEVER